MFSAAVSVVLALALLFGGAGAAAYAAQEALPTDFLYPVKLFTEDVQLDLARTPEAKLDVLLSQVQRRAGEVAALAASGEAVPASTVIYFERQVDQAILLASAMDEGGLVLVVDGVHNAIRKCDRDMVQSRTNQPEDAPANMYQIRAMLQHRLGQLEDALADPQAAELLLLGEGDDDLAPPIEEEPAEDPLVGRGNGNMNGAGNEEKPGPQGTGPGEDAGVWEAPGAIWGNVKFIEIPLYFGPGAAQGQGPQFQAGPDYTPETQAGPGPAYGPGPGGNEDSGSGGTADPGTGSGTGPGTGTGSGNGTGTGSGSNTAPGGGKK